MKEERISPINNKIKYLFEDKGFNHITKKVVFIDIYGNEIRCGDRIQFFLAGDIFPRNGVVSNLNGLRVACFSTFLNKWKYYQIDLVEPEN